MADALKQEDSNTTKQTPDEMVSFSVMPHSGDMGKNVGSPSAPPTGQNRPSMDSGSPPPPLDHESIWHSKATYFIISVLVLLVLGGLAYFLLWSDSSKNNEAENASAKLPKVFVKQYFGVDSCVEISKCGDDADADRDGLTNYEEFVEQSDPTNNDTDADGLSDGDEFNVYLTNPIEKFTDSRPASVQGGYSDGSQIKNDYDPLTPGLKMTEVRKQQIRDATTEYGLHEPTTTTMQSSNAPQAKTVTIFIVNNKFDPPITTINKNDTVVWLNKDATQHQIMSNVHPAHDILPDLGSGNLATNQTYSYKFTTAGTFAYHDEKNPAIGGSIEVK